MKYFTYTFTLLLIGLILPINAPAQEKQNDATWEETIDFLKNNIDRFNTSQLVKYYDSAGNLKVETENQVTYQIYDNLKKTGKNRSYEANLMDLASVEPREDESSCDNILLRFTKNSVRYVDDVIGERSSSFIIINFMEEQKMTETSQKYEVDEKCISQKWNLEDRFVKRMESAFKHLAYLAEEKRQQSKF